MSHTKKGDKNMQVERIGLDIAKSSFQVHGVEAHGKVRLRKQLSRGKVLPYFAQLPPCLVGLEACGAHYWARELQKLGHDVRRMAAAMIQPCRTGQKNDQNDAEAICEAVSRPRTRFVPVKSEAQQAYGDAPCSLKTLPLKGSPLPLVGHHCVARVGGVHQTGVSPPETDSGRETPRRGSGGSSLHPTGHRAISGPPL